VTAIAAPHVPPPTPLRRNLVFGAIAAAIILGWVGDALWGSLIDRNPLVLLLLNDKPRYQLLVVNELEPWVFYPVALVRLLITKPLVWLVGAWYGPRVVDWIQSRSERTGRVVRWMQRHFPRYGWVIMIITTSNPVCLLAGSVGYPLAWLMAWAVIGTLIRLWAVDVVGGALSDQIAWFIEWVADHRVPVVLASITVVLVGIWWQRRRGLSPLDELQSLEDAVEASAAETAEGRDGGRSW
jgi:membrane protein DedA with SNARE-associated domain